MTILTIAGVYQDALEEHVKYAGALDRHQEAQQGVMVYIDFVAEREIAVKEELIAESGGELPGSNADKRRAALDMAYRADESLTNLNDLLGQKKRAVVCHESEVKAAYMRLQIMRAYLGALGSLGA